MARAELGRGNGGWDTINIYDVGPKCPPDCSLRKDNGQFQCNRHNGDAVVVVTGGITRQTLSELATVAPCLNGQTE